MSHLFHEVSSESLIKELEKCEELCKQGRKQEAKHLLAHLDEHVTQTLMSGKVGNEDLDRIVKKYESVKKVLQ